MDEGSGNNKKKLSVKEKKFLKHYIECGNLAQSARFAGMKGKDNHSLSQQGYRLPKRIELQFDELMEMKGLTDSRILAGIEALTEATIVKAKTKDGETIIKEYADSATRLRAWELLARLKGKLKEKVEMKVDQPQQLVIIAKHYSNTCNLQPGESRVVSRQIIGAKDALPEKIPVEHDREIHLDNTELLPVKKNSPSC